MAEKKNNNFDTDLKDREILYKELGIEKANIRSPDSIETNLAIELTEEMLLYHKIIPLELGKEGTLRLVMADPLDMIAQQIVSSKTGLIIEPLYSYKDDIEYAISRIFSPEVTFEETMQGLVEKEEDFGNVDEEEESIDLIASQTSDSPSVIIVNTILVQAIRERASDIHIEPQENHLRIRLRIDGVLRDFPPADKKLLNGVVARVKILANLDIAEKRLPQDGRVKFKIMGRSVDVRVSTVPGIYGEKIVMRILDRGSTSLSINDIGLEPESLALIEEASIGTHGLILSTGPTGSGKTTTIYSILNHVNEPTLNVLTIEDPVEYRLSGINQVQVMPTIGLTFAKALRAFLRQDPDVIMVGEIRDFETAELAVKAALTGHLVLSTLHTNDAVATIIRLIDMGIDKYLIIASLSLIMAQRLVRRICVHCKEKTKISPELILALKSKGIKHDPKLKLSKGAGCEECSYTGFWGRLAITEMLPVTNEIRELINVGSTEVEIRKAAEVAGMIPLFQDGYKKAGLGLTTLDEVFRVV